MEITIFTIAVSILWVSLSVKAISLFRKQMCIIGCFSIYPLLTALALCIVRILLPVEMPFSCIIESKKILPAIYLFFFDPFLKTAGFCISIASILSIIWASGTIIIFLKYIKGYYQFRHSLTFLPVSKDLHLYDILDKADWGNRRNIKILLNNSFASPAIVGFWHPVILLPDAKFNDDQLLGFFIHELSHYNLKHHLIKLTARLIHACFWWNPLLLTLSSEISHALEMHSDKIVCSKLTSAQQQAYMSGIIQIIHNQKFSSSEKCYCCSLTEDKDNAKLKQRFHMIANHTCQNNSRYPKIAIVLILIVFMLSYAVVFQPYFEPTSQDYGSMVPEPLNDQLYYFIEMERGYGLYDRNGQFLCIVKDPASDKIFEKIKIYKNKEDLKKK